MALTERLQKTTEVGFWTGQIPLEYVYTCGRAGEVFFRNLKDKGVFTGARCDRCDLVYVPPRTYCEKCFDRLEDSYVEVPGRGMIHTYTVLFRNLDGSTKETPVALAMISLDGTDGGVVHYIGEIDLEDLCIGLPVEAVLKPEKDRVGGISDILYFKPAF